MDYLLNKHKVFLGGTCNEDPWRDQLIPMLRIPYFNPVVKDWTPECQQEEYRQKDNICDIHLYVITPAITGFFTPAEIIDSCTRDGVVTVCSLITNNGKMKLKESSLRSLRAVMELADKHGAYVCEENNLKNVADTINYLASLKDYFDF